MMVSDFIALVSRMVHLGVMPFVMMVVICTFIGWLTHRLIRGMQSDLLVGVIFIIAAGISLETWQQNNQFEWIFLITATVMIGANLYRRIINGR